ncbi:hypothetical protein F4815DRAFT_372956 [Daldinia loculata]|nr:hypothetical protein F4815DRAFT_372956 [Daldinia loculata]
MLVLKENYICNSYQVALLFLIGMVASISSSKYGLLFQSSKRPLIRPLLPVYWYRMSIMLPSLVNHLPLFRIKHIVQIVLITLIPKCIF